jgi:hypothetical protein
MTTRAAASMHNATASEHDGDTMEMTLSSVRETLSDHAKRSESTRACEQAFKALVAEGVLKDTIYNRMLYHRSWKDCEAWALGVMKEEIER